MDDGAPFRRLAFRLSSSILTATQEVIEDFEIDCIELHQGFV
jgi:hypothetical protein